MPSKVISVHFVRTKLVVGMSNYAFEVVDIETLDTQPLLDPTVTLRELKTAKCLAIYRLGYPAGNEFLLCCERSFFPSLRRLDVWCLFRVRHRVRLRLLHKQVRPSLAA